MHKGSFGVSGPTVVGTFLGPLLPRPIAVFELYSSPEGPRGQIGYCILELFQDVVRHPTTANGPHPQIRGHVVRRLARYNRRRNDVLNPFRSVCPPIEPTVYSSPCSDASHNQKAHDYYGDDYVKSNHNAVFLRLAATRTSVRRPNAKLTAKNTSETLNTSSDVKINFGSGFSVGLVCILAW